MRARYCVNSRLIVWICLAALSVLFIQAAQTGGHTWDERSEFGALKSKLEFASNALGDDKKHKISRDFRDLPNDHEYYGLGATFPAYAVAHFLDTVWLGERETSFESFSIVLHLWAFACALGAAWYVGKLVRFSADSCDLGMLAAAALLVIPAWVGYSFFDYKDLPVALGVIAAVYYASRLHQDPNVSWGARFFAALLLLGSLKLAALVLVLPACVLVLWSVLRLRSMKMLAYFVAMTVAFLAALYAITPPSWYEPITFVKSSLEYMSHHAWGVCTVTAGECIGRNYNDGAGYSAAKYLGLWYGAQLPVLFLLGLAAALIFYVRDLRRSNATKHLIFLSLLWPLAAIIVTNSTLYDGIRHTLFLIPLAVSFVFVSIPAGIYQRWRPALVAYGLFLLIDGIAIQPYQYIWFNELARFYANETNYETDYWGFSLREAAALGNRQQKKNEWIVGSPAHLVGPYVRKRHIGEVENIPEKSRDTYLFVRYTRYRLPPAKACKVVKYVKRHELFAPHPLKLAFVARCPLDCVKPLAPECE